MATKLRGTIMPMTMIELEDELEALNIDYHVGEIILQNGSCYDVIVLKSGQPLPDVQAGVIYVVTHSFTANASRITIGTTRRDRSDGERGYWHYAISMRQIPLVTYGYTEVDNVIVYP